MANVIKTVLTYPLDGSTRDFNIPFEYLARKFVVVTLIGVDRKVLTLNTDYRFATRTTISLTKAWGPADGYTTIELRRVTSTTDRLVDFTDGSILRAYDLNVAQIQTMHVAEEARDLTADTIGVNNDGHLDARGRRIVNLANAVDDRDAVPLGQLKVMDQSSWQARNEALQFRNGAETFRNQAEGFKNESGTNAANTYKWRNEAEGFRDEAEQFKNAAGQYADAAGSYAGNAKDSEDEARRIAASIRAAGLFGYITRQSFEKGFNVTVWNEVLLWEDEGEYYRWDGTLPKNVPAGSTPETSGGIGLGAWVSVGDAALRSEIFNKYIDWVTPDHFRLATETDDTQAWVRALAVSKRVKLRARTYYVNADTIVTSSDDVYIIGEGSAHTKIVANSSGSVLVKLGGAPNNPASVRQRISVQGVTLDGAGLVTNTFVTSASQSPRLCDDVVVTGATSHGFVHTRGWSTFARGLVCTNNGEQGLRLEGDNNNTHWEGMWSHNGTIGIYVKNAGAVSFTGSIENNGEEGAVIDASATKQTGFVNIESSAVLFTNACYFESNGKKAPGTYAEVRFGGDGGGVVRDCLVEGAHIGVPADGIGVLISGAVKRLHLNSVGLYPVGSPLAYIQYSSAFSSMSAVMNADCVFTNINVAADKIVAAGFADTNGELAAYVFGGGNKATTNKTFITHNVKLNDENITGTYLERIYRGAELISERGVKPNVQVWNNAAHPSGYHSYAVDGTEVFRITSSNISPVTDNSKTLGTPTSRWSTVYAGTGTISTSDERLKATVQSDKYTLSNEALAAAEIKKSIYRFKFTDSITAKGEQYARIHFGVGAQTVHDILIKYGLKPSDYAFWCYDEWNDELDDNGNIIIHTGDRYGIRYDELCMFIMAYV